MSFGKTIVPNKKRNLLIKSFALITISLILCSSNANGLSKTNVESTNSIKSCGSSNIESNIFNLNLLNTTQTESLTAQKSSCGSIPTKSINQIK